MSASIEKNGQYCQVFLETFRKLDNKRLKFMINPEPKLKRALSEKIRRKLTNLLKSLGFKRTKSTFWTRSNEHTVEFIHLHLFTFASDFRIHFGIRVLNDGVETVALNGPDSPPGPNDKVGRYNFRFTSKIETVDRCSSELFRFIVEHGEPWFREFGQLSELLRRYDSPLNEKEKKWLKLAIEGTHDQDNITKSNVLLGLDR